MQWISKHRPEAVFSRGELCFCLGFIAGGLSMLVILTGLIG